MEMNSQISLPYLFSEFYYISFSGWDQLHFVIASYSDIQLLGFQVLDGLLVEPNPLVPSFWLANTIPGTEHLQREVEPQQLVQG